MKWTLSGRFLRQHDPEILPNGHILLFDNLGGVADGRAPPNGRSRILEIDPATQAIVWMYQGGDSPADRFDCERGGNVQKLPNGNVLVTAAWEERVFEVTGDAHPRIRLGICQPALGYRPAGYAGQPQQRPQRGARRADLPVDPVLTRATAAAHRAPICGLEAPGRPCGRPPGLL